MRQFVSRNPVNNKVLSEFKFLNDHGLEDIINNSKQGYLHLQKSSFKQRAEKLKRLSVLLDQNLNKYAKLISTEIGKPIQQSIAEVKKSSAYCNYYAEIGDKYLKHTRVKTEATNSFVRYDPIGTVYSISPFNFPFWLCNIKFRIGFKPIIPMITLGNAVIHRPSDSTGLCGLALEELFKEAGFDNSEFQNVFSSPEQLEYIMKHQQVQGVSFTGSTRAGSIIGAVASKYLKRSVLELGGSDPFCVLSKADLNLAVQLAVRSRSANCGQVCFSAKRFIVHQQFYEKFKTNLVDSLSKLKIGDPLDENTNLGPMARTDLVDNLIDQLDRGIAEGATISYGGKRLSKEGNFFMPTVVEVTEKNTLAQEETFGPVWALIKAEDNDDILRIANNSNFGLGAVIVSSDKSEYQEFIEKIESGMVFVNEVVKSDQRLPSGGVKQSGYGRECGSWGVHNFANVKTVWIQ